MSSYFIAHIKINDPEEYEKYLGGFDEIFAKYNGKVIAVDDRPMVLEGEWPYTRAVVIRFSNEKDLMHWYDSAEYQSLAKHRRQASKADIIVVKGRE